MPNGQKKPPIPLWDDSGVTWSARRAVDPVLALLGKVPIPEGPHSPPPRDSGVPADVTAVAPRVSPPSTGDEHADLYAAYENEAQPIRAIGAMVKRNVIDPTLSTLGKLWRGEPVLPEGEVREKLESVFGSGKAQASRQAVLTDPVNKRGWDVQSVAEGVTSPVQNVLTQYFATQRGEQISRISGRPPITVGMEGNLGEYASVPEPNISINAETLSLWNEILRQEQPGRDLMRDVAEHELGHAFSWLTEQASDEYRLDLLSNYASEVERQGLTQDEAFEQALGFAQSPISYALSLANEFGAETVRQAFRILQSPNTERAQRIVRELEENEPRGRGRQVAADVRAIEKALGIPVPKK